MSGDLLEENSKVRKKRGKRKSYPLIERAVTDDNFAHVLRMFPLMRIWAAGLRDGLTVDLNSKNMFQMPVETAEAFIRHHAAEETDLGAVCRDVVRAIDGNDPSFACERARG